MSGDLGQRKRKIILYAVLTIAVILMMLLVVATGDYGSLGYGTWRNNVVTLATLAGWVLTTLTMIGLTRLHTPMHGITSWRRVGVVTLILWAVVVVYYATGLLFRDTGLGATAASVFPIVFLFMPSIFWFPVWVVVAAIRGSSHPERLAERSDEVDLKTTGQDARDAVDSLSNARSALLLARPPATAPLVASTSPDVPANGLDAANLVVPEEDAASSEPTRRYLPLAVAAVMILLALMTVGYVADQWAQAREAQELTSRIEASRETLEKWNADEFKEIKRIDPATNSLDELNAQITSITSLANNDLPPIATTGAEIEQVSYLPWHSGVADLRRTYLDYSRAWTNQVTAVASASKWQDLIDDSQRQYPEINRTFAVAKAYYPAAVPRLFSGDLNERLQHAFKN